MTPRGDTRSRSFSVHRLIYVSSAGRFFVKVSVNSRDTEVGPGDKTPKGGAREVTFQGGKIVGHSQKGGGAGQMVIRFDSSYASCTVDAAYGKPPGKHVTFTNRRGKQMELLSVTNSGESCSIRDGNALAN
jgi:hypothetical protein